MTMGKDRESGFFFHNPNFILLNLHVKRRNTIADCVRFVMCGGFLSLRQCRRCCLHGSHGGLSGDVRIPCLSADSPFTCQMSTNDSKFYSPLSSQHKSLNEVNNAERRCWARLFGKGGCDSKHCIYPIGVIYINSAEWRRACLRRWKLHNVAAGRFSGAILQSATSHVASADLHVMVTGHAD